MAAPSEERQSALARYIEQSAREAVKKAAAEARAVKLARQQNRVVRRMVGYIDSTSDSSDVTNGSDDPPSPAVDAYTEDYNRAGDRKDKGPA